MLIELKRDSLEKTHINYDSNKKCYGFTSKGSIDVLIYGYPYHSQKNTLVTPEDIHDSYINDDLNIIHSIDGIYSIILLDRVHKNCSVIVDRYGMFKLFSSKSNDCLIISDSISEILQKLSNIKLNQKSIIEFLSFGFKLGNKTHIEGVDEFEAATINTITNNLDINKNIYWKYLAKSGQSPKSYDELLDIYNKHINTSFRLGKKVVLPLSGGLDTRTIISSCIKNNNSVRCYTYSPDKTYDLQIAQKICKHFGIQHDYYRLDQNWINNIPKMLEENINQFNGLLPALSYLHIITVCQNEINKSDLIIWGMLGNEIWRGHLSSYAVNNIDDDPGDNILKQFGVLNNAIIDTYSKSIKSDLINNLKEEINNEIQSDQTETHLKDPIEMFVYKNYGANWAGKLFQFSGKYLIPFSAHLNKDILQSIPALNLHKRHTGALHKYIINNNNKYLASIPMEPENRARGTVISNNLVTQLKGKIIIFTYLLSKVINIFSRKLFNTDLLRFTLRHDYPYWMRKYHKQYVKDVLTYDNMTTKSYFNKAGLELLINEYISGNDTPAQFIIRLISLEIWLKNISHSNNIRI